VREGERIIAILNVGEPAEVPPAKPRQPASSFTTWMP
jgi:nitroreductase